MSEAALDNQSQPLVVVFDTETSGLSPSSGHRIIEIGAVLLQGSQVMDEFHSLIDADCDIAPQAFAVHGISKRMLRNAPTSAELFPRFLDFIGSADLVAHNAPFDLRFLRHECDLLGVRLRNRSHCTLQLGRRHWPKLVNHKLVTLAAHAGVDLSNMRQHRALDDARVTADVWLALQKSAP